MVGTLDHLEIVLDDDYGVTTRDEGIERLKEFLDVVEMKTCGWFVEDEHRGHYLLLTNEIGELYALVFSTRESGRILTQFDISKTYIMQRLESLYDFRLLPLSEKLDSLIDSHVEDVGDILAMEPHLKYVALESLAMTMLALKHKVGHKLHLDGDDACSLTFLTSAALGIE